MRLRNGWRRTRGNETMIAKKERNVGIELLRIVSMFMIVLLHCVNHTQLHAATSASTAHALSIYFPYGASQCAVNIYAMITGYVCVQSKYRPSRYVEIWLQVFALNAAFGLADIVQNGLQIKTLVHCLFPVSSGTFWYFSSYTLLFLCMPYLNRLLLSISKQRYKKLLLMLAVVSTVAWLALFLFNQDMFATDAGYSPFWLMVLYCAGAYIKIFEADFQTWKAGRCLCVFVFLSVVNGLSMPALKWLTTRLLGYPTKERFLLSYLSPTTILAAVSIVLCALKLRIKTGKRAIVWLGSLTFGIYIIHMQPFFREHIIGQYFANAASQSWYTVLVEFLGFALAVFAACAVLDWIRKLLFRLLRVPQFAAWVAQKGSAIVQKITS